VVYAGRLAREKGPDVLLEAWPAVSPAAHLLIVGDGEDRAALQTQNRRGVQFLGAVTDTAPYLRAADVGVLPSRSEGLSVALLEGMSCGLPMVATAVGGTADALEDERTGLLVPPEDPPALAAALRRALGPEGAVLGKNARDRVLRSYSIDAVADRTLDLYWMVCRERAADLSPRII
jgi:glycosyltransferase involved in cell wall biosynthesis